MDHFVDTHFHLDLYDNPAEMASAIEEQEIYAVTMTNSPTVFDYSFQLTLDSEYLRPAIGLHPELAAQRIRETELFPEALNKTRYVGEVGLDYVTDDVRDKELQREALGKILDACDGYNDRILSLHSRRAAGDVISAVGSAFPGTAVLHWFSGTVKELEQAIEYGFLFSVNLAMIRSKKGQAIVSKLPKDRVLTESDGPFVSNGSAPSSPLDIPLVVAGIAEVWRCTASEVKSRVFDTFSMMLRNCHHG